MRLKFRNLLFASLGTIALVVAFFYAGDMIIQSNISDHHAEALDDKGIIKINDETTLANAITAANTNPGPDTITLGVETITLTTSLPNITDQLTIEGEGQTQSIIQRDLGAPSFGILYSTADLTLRSLAIKNADRTPAVASGNGGGAYVAGAALVVDDVLFEDNNASDEGGGLAVQNSGSSLSVTNSTFLNNTARQVNSCSGGAILGKNSISTIDIDNSYFEGNGATDGKGGALCIGGAGIAMTITNSIFDGNYTNQSCSGIEFSLSVGANTLTFDNNIVRNGYTTNIGGQAMLIYNLTGTVTNSLIENNAGYGMIIIGASKVTVRNTRTIDNGGLGIWLYNPVNKGESYKYASINDAGDVDTGSNDLMNYPVIDHVTYLGGSSYRVSGTIDGNLAEAPFYIELCKGTSDSSGHGQCSSILGNTTTSNDWEMDVNVAGSYGYDDVVFTATATNTNGSTSEYSENFVGSEENDNYENPAYPIDLVSPSDNENVRGSSVLLDWLSNGDPDGDAYEVYLSRLGNKSSCDVYTFAEMEKIGTVSSSITSYQTTRALSTGSYCWGVIGINSDGIERGESDIWRFYYTQFKTPFYYSEELVTTEDEIIDDPLEDDIQTSEESDTQETVSENASGDLTTDEGRTALWLLIFLDEIFLILIAPFGTLFGIFLGKKESYWGYVFNSDDHSAVSYALVKLFKSSASGDGMQQVGHTRTDNRGGYTFGTKAEGNYLLEVVAVGYEKQTRNISLSVGKMVRENFGLRKDLDNKLNQYVNNYVKFRGVLRYINPLMMIAMLIGFAYSLYVTNSNRTFINYVIVGLYVILFFVNLIVYLVTFSSKKVLQDGLEPSTPAL